jgi:hypothetical protein
MREYMLKTLTPSCFLVRNLRPEGEAPDRLASVGVRVRRGAGVLDLEIDERGRGLRGSDEAGE